MGAYDTQLDELAAGLLQEQFGESITYTTIGGVASEINAIAGSLSEQQDYGDDGYNIYQMREFEILNDSDTGIVAPVFGDSISYDGLVYFVIRIISTTLATHRIEGKAVIKRRATANDNTMRRS